MGCDIHLYVEKREGNKWVSADTWETSEYEPKHREVPYRQHYYSDRNYHLFAILADVRNGYGFAGIKTGEGFAPISEAKDLPDDVSPEVAAASAHWGCDGHSHSWHTVADLMAYDWTQTTQLQGVVTAPEYWEWSRWRKSDGLGPESYCGARSGRDTRTLTEPELATIVKAKTKGLSLEEAEDALKPLHNLQTTVTWGVPYYRAAKHFLGETLPRLWRLGKPEDVRIVFWFDN